MNTIARVYRGHELDYKTAPGVIGRDYYKDHLVSHLHDEILPVIERADGMRVLDMATGHGYSAVILAKLYRDRVAKITAYDINPRAVELAKENAAFHGCDDLIDFRVGTLYEPLKPNERFDLVLSALPPVPVSTEDLQSMPDDVRAHHWVASTAGRTGRDLLDAMIDGAPLHLQKRGVIATATADFQNMTKHTLSVMHERRFDGKRVGEPSKQYVADTKLTVLAKQNIEALGYRFHSSDGQDSFFVETYAGKLRDQIDSSYLNCQ